MEKDERYMRRAIGLATRGAGHVSPNPMVGAVIVSEDGSIIGEGWHRMYGGPHAEVNAVRSVRETDRQLLRRSTIYVTLEPCSHYGKTPPCALLLRDTGFRRVVTGCGDPNPKVAGRGIAMLREAGIEVTEDCLRDECRALNIRFITAHTEKRPWILLKWAEDEHGAMSAPDGSPLQISSPVTATLMHRERSLCDAIMVGTGTLLGDNPQLCNRFWPGNSPRPVIFDSPRWHDEKIKEQLKVFDRDPIILDPSLPLEENMRRLFSEYGITSLMVEGGRRLLDSFIAAGLYDRTRIERKALLDQSDQLDQLDQ